MKKLYRPVGLALVMMLGIILLSCNREGAGDKKSMMLLDQDPLSAKDNPAIVTRDSPSFASAEHPPLFEPAPWLKPGDARPNGMETDSSPAEPEKTDFSKGVPIPEEPKPGGPVKY